MGKNFYVGGNSSVSIINNVVGVMFYSVGFRVEWVGGFLGGV